ncbi:alpha/beta hydrolase [Amycolatopsis ultiminotia]|uniref:alpha/beta hydrolase n=1 Tax=Amycolatopsis ultiminotia TaxID=543629 RepID=UPI0031E576AC
MPPLPAGSEPAPDADNELSSHLYVICGGNRWSKSVRSYQRDVAIDRIRYPSYGAAAANIRACAYWPSQPIDPKVRVSGNGPSNVLMTQNRRDPGTPLTGARQLRAAFGDRARMVTVDQGGHGVYLFGSENTCASDTVTTFLTTGGRPAHDRTCAAEPR